MQLELRADDNYGATRVIDAFTEQILAETAALALEHIAQRFQGSISSASHGATVPAVVEQSVHGLLKHSLFIANDHVRCFEQEEVLEPVITINNTAIKVVQVGGRKTPAFQGD